VNNYCSQKFWWLTVEPERRQIQSCCAAYPHKIDLNWIKNNPGKLFNAPVLLQERTDMLNDVPVASCEASCWSAERGGKTSRRLYMKSYEKSHTDIYANPEVLSINLGSDCNLTCVYCTKQYSTAWLRDIINNGPYIDDPRYQINNDDKITIRLGQKKITNHESYNLIIEELAHYTDCKEIFITGGEPFLHNNLADIVKSLKHNQIRLYTGLGVDTNRLERILNQMPNNVEFVVSAENIDRHYEFVRYNNSFSKFTTNLNLIREHGKVVFNSVVSNLTIFNFDAFEQYYPDDEIILNFCNDPDYLSLNVLDEESKEIILEKTFRTNPDLIHSTLKQNYEVNQKNNLVTFLKQYASRRNLDLNLFPKHFITWLNTAQ
jgi:pyruvate-formate lyase-activating enzyme